MKLKNHLLKSLGDFLVNEELSGRLSRSRTRFVKLLNARLEEVERFRKELCEKYCEKDNDGKPVLNNNAYSIKDVEAFNEEYNDLMNEEFIIDETASQKEILTNVKSILDNTKQTFKGVDALLYDQWCEAFEEGDEN